MLETHYDFSYICMNRYRQKLSRIVNSIPIILFEFLIRIINFVVFYYIFWDDEINHFLNNMIRIQVYCIRIMMFLFFVSFGNK